MRLASSTRSATKPAREGTGDEFCVIDVETTGFSPRLGDRVIEVAAVRVRAGGEVIDEWSTLVNPGRDLGPTHIHGISAGDVLDAPDFSRIGGDLIERIDGAVLVAHNLRFDRGFLEAEFARAGHRIAPHPGLCTLALARRLRRGGSRKLVDCCAEFGIPIGTAHSALDDARATSRLLIAHLELARRRGVPDLESLGCDPLVWPDELPALPPYGRRHLRGATAGRLDAQADYLAHLVRRLDGRDDEGADAGAYLDLLDRALDDRRVSAREAHALAQTAEEWGLSQAATRRAHLRYLGSLCDAACVDGVVTDAEHRDLALVTRLLALTPGDLDAALREGAERADGPRGRRPAAHEALAGKSVCFTGALSATINGAPITRRHAERFAHEAGLVVIANVTKKLDLLVVADPDSLSGKARRARDLGTRIIAEPVFWRTIGVGVD